jgi:hypothetical protein
VHHLASLQVEGGVSMTKPIFRVYVFSCAIAALAGCENLPRRGQQPAPQSLAPVIEGDKEAESTAAPKGFFKQGSRIPGAMSSEGAEIEHSLGVQ